MTIYERRAGLFFILLGVAVSIYTLSTLKLGTIHQPGPGLFPLISGVGIAALAAFWLAANRKCNNDCEPLWQESQWLPPLLGVIVTIVYAALMEPLGYTLSTLIFLLAWQKIIEREKWLKASIIAVVGTVTMYIVFAYLLRVDLPGELFG